jgi:hypothetical protein
MLLRFPLRSVIAARLGIASMIQVNRPNRPLGRTGLIGFHDDVIWDALFDILWEAGYSVRKEARGNSPLREGDTEGRVMDLVAADPDGGPHLLSGCFV